MKLILNLALFFVVFLPAVCLTGLVGGFFVGPHPPPRLAYPILVFTVTLRLLLPSLVMVPVIHFGFRRWLRDRPPRTALALAAAVTPLALLLPHLAIFGARYWSVPLIVLFVVPGALYGLALRR